MLINLWVYIWQKYTKNSSYTFENLSLPSLSPPLRSQNAGRKPKCYCIMAPYCRQSKDLLVCCQWNFHWTDNKRRLVQTVLCLWNYVRGQANYALCKVAQNGCTTSVLKARANLHAVGDNGSCIRSDSDVFLVMLSPLLQSPPLRIHEFPVTEWTFVRE